MEKNSVIDLIDEKIISEFNTIGRFFLVAEMCLLSIVRFMEVW